MASESSDEETDNRVVQFIFASCLFDSGIFEEQDCKHLLELEESDSEDSGTYVRSRSRSRQRRHRNKTSYDSIDEFDRVVKHRIRGKKSEKYRSRNVIENETTDEDSSGKRVLNYRKRVHDRLVTSVFPEHIRMESEDCSKKRKIIKRVKKDYIEDSSDSSSSLASQSKHKMQPSLSSLQNCNDIRVTEESVKPAQELFGYYFCEVCKLELSSEKVYHDHMNGKRHLKALKLKNVPKAIAQSIPPSAATNGQSKYPKPPYGVIRRKIKERAKIEEVIRNEVRKPCPGLFLVTEIQGIKETTYYCSVCNSVCSANSILSHLTGFKHQLTLVKHFKPGAYETFNSERKNEIHGPILSILQAIQRRDGLGRMTVERDELLSYSKDTSDVYRPSTSRDMRGTSFKDSGMSFGEYYDEAAIPNRSSAGFFCEHCDAHMNNEVIWKSHIAGKRHIANLKKLPGDPPSKTKTVAVKNARATLLDRLKNECPDEPIVGLGEIREIQIKEVNSESYRCFLCASCHTTLDIIDHLRTSKHRMKYLDHIQYPYKFKISGLSETISDSVIHDICAKIEAKEGRGKPAVHIDKSAFYS